MDAAHPSDPTVRVKLDDSPVVSQAKAEAVIDIPGYEIIGKIAEGGMGAVYKAKQTSMDRLVALKVLLSKYAAEADGRERFLREARAVAKLSHPNIVAGIDAGEANGVYFFVMEFLDGESVDKTLRRRTRLPSAEAAGIIRQIALGLDHAHQNGMVHRDIKPANIMLLPDGTAKLADLGLVRLASAGDVTLTQSGTIVGSPGYVSPEQAMGEREIDIRSDIYSLGLTFFEFLSGERAYSGDNPMTVISARFSKDVPIEKLAEADAPKDMVAVVATMTRRDPKSRYQTPQALLQDLNAVLAGKQPALAVADAVARVRRPGRRAATIAAAAVCLLSLAALATVLGANGWFGTQPAAVEPTNRFLALAPRAKLSLLDAIGKAREHGATGVAVHVELEPGIRAAVYSIDFAQGPMNCNVIVDAEDGHVIEMKTERDDHSAEVDACKTTLEAAILIALKKEPGQAVEAELVRGGKGMIEVKTVREGMVAGVEIETSGDVKSIDEAELARRAGIRP